MSLSKIWTILSCVVFNGCLINPILAQTHFYFGANVQLNHTSFINSDDAAAKDTVHRHPKYRFSVGLDLRYHLKNQGLSDLIIGVGYSSFKESYIYENSYEVQPGKFKNHSDATTNTVNYIKIPVSIRYSFRAIKEFIPYIEVGWAIYYTYNYQVEQQSIFIDTGGGKFQRGFTSTPKGTIYVENGVKSPLYDDYMGIYHRLNTGPFMKLGINTNRHSRLNFGAGLSAEYLILDAENKSSSFFSYGSFGGPPYIRPVTHLLSVGVFLTASMRI